MNEQFFKVFLYEAFGHRKTMVIIFVAICLVMTVVGILWPKGYRVSTTILVDEKNIIQPLMAGAAVPTDVTDRARLAREIISGRKIMQQILEDTGWLDDEPSAEEQERIMKQLVGRTTVTNLGRNLIKIEYRDDDPERAFLTTKRYADLFVSESIAAKATESRSAFDFIDKQVAEYHEKLMKAEEALKEFRSANLDAQPGADADFSTRLNLLQTRIDEATRELRETEIRKKSLERQLSGEAEVASVISREAQYRARIAELQAQLETLRLSYHDSYPDIVRLRHQIDDLNQAIAVDRQRREQAKTTGSVPIDENIVNNPMYQQLRRDLSQTQVHVDMLAARIAQARRQLETELERGKRIQGGAATLAELTRDYQVNREIYQDLLRRRENARVSMNLDSQNHGLTFKVQEPAILPIQPSGPRFWHFLVAGLILGVAVPVGLIYAKIQIDPRLRIAQVIAERHKIPVLAAVPQLWSPRDAMVIRREMQWLSLAVGSTILAMALFVTLRLMRML